MIPSQWPSQDRESQTDALVALALQGREEQARKEISALMRKGVSFEDVQVGLLAAAADRLGALWETDSVSFVDVTIAVGTLQRLMHFVALDLKTDPLTNGAGRSICIFPEPGAEHTFGASMAAEFFKHAGWDVTFVPDADRQSLRRMIAGRHLDVVGLSLNRAEMVEPAAALLAELRAASRNPRTLFIAGGSALARTPTLIHDLGADAAIVALKTAATNLEKLVDRTRTKRES